MCWKEGRSMEEPGQGDGHLPGLRRPEGLLLIGRKVRCSLSLGTLMWRTCVLGGGDEMLSDANNDAL